MRKRYILTLLGGVILIFVIVLGYYFMNPSLLNGGVSTFGPMKLGGENPGGIGSYTFAPERHIPASKFYITVVAKDLSCVFSYCAPEGDKIQAAGGWLQGEDTDQPTIRSIFGLKASPAFASVVVVADGNNKLVGIYPDKTVSDLSSILKIHSRLVDAK